MNNRPFVLSIAGLDPSAGAGILADIKTFEQHQIYGLGVCSAITFQHDNHFEGVTWLDNQTIIHQAKLLFDKYPIDFVKIGLVQSLKDLDEIINTLLSWNSTIKIIWDPILKASAGFDFHENINQILLEKILKKIYLITPNLPELQLLVVGGSSVEQKAFGLSKFCNVYLKGGHSDNEICKDILFTGINTFSFTAERIPNGEKHGSGCVLSSAITANLSKGLSLEETCENAKHYMNQFLKSNPSLLGYHFQS
ncbi:hydroxymethylpyrimidine/phosphomethylpyrimidine kinase [Arcicella aquatica]|uniref:hydroxymethylpyrimidine kinase n=1 Tax=Arcicella aquatica TaxID=217141 RepID=A0ABU5QJ89_9BACT|nr:hydroxymethylpyrimidine/phosphomethylpyrimidine kinase [Arcicella aquatica]MEA5256794.1 hydroxymethylpyrimidine/phosphomethylpyrimidine kinase [Arcicella aquatica]